MGLQFLRDKDIVANGFVFAYEDKDPTNGNRVFSKSINGMRGQTIRHLIFNPMSSWVLICDGYDEVPYSEWDTRFSGQIFSSHDLSTVLSMLK